MSLPVIRFRFHGLRNLNWAPRGGVAYDEHSAAEGFDQWLEPGAFAIVVGPNAGGKSTVIDLLRAIGEPRIWPSLARENYPGDDFSGFDIESSRFRLSVRFSKWTPDVRDTFDKLTILAVAHGPGDVRSARVVAPKYELDGDWVAPLRDVLDACVAVPVHHLPATGRHPGEELDDPTLVSLLNEISPQFPSVRDNPQVPPFRLYRGRTPGEGRIGVLFKDDGGQHAFVHRRALPLGWLQLASVLAFVRGCAPKSLIVLDEPDRHLHPSLQRVMLDLVARERSHLGAQVALATHSSVLINPELCARIGATTLVAARGLCEVLTDARRVLDDLGVTSGDLVQANGLIWVEGPSDRIYIKTWLERLARHRGETPSVERVHYAFVSYGGAMLKHLTLAHGNRDKLELRSINRNFALVVDRDVPQGDRRPLGREKARLLTEAGDLGPDPHVWVTEGYTIESYLPPDWPATAKFVRVDAAGRTRVQRIGKVELATRFQREDRTWPESFLEGSDLPARIEALHGRIAAWQTPQEAIVATHVPPFLMDPKDRGDDEPPDRNAGGQRG